MDPTACLHRIGSTEGDERDKACEDLQTWLRGGGFQPEWEAEPDGTKAFAVWRKRNGIRSPRINVE